MHDLADPIRRSTTRWVTSTRTLRLAFAAVAATFTLTIAATQIANLRIREMAEKITGNTSPSIALLSSMRSTTRELEAAADDLVEECASRGCTAIPVDLDAHRRKLWTEWVRYQRLPTSPGERDAWPTVERLLRALDVELMALRRDASSSDPHAMEAQFHARVQPSIGALDKAIAGIVELEYAYGAGLAARIDTTASRSLALAIALVIACLALTVFTATLAIALVRRHERMMRLHAEDLDRYAGRVAHEVSGPLWAASAALDVARHAAEWRRGEALERATRSVELAKQLAKGLLEFARSGVACEPDAWDDLATAMEVVAENLGPVADREGVDLRFEAPLERRVACRAGILESIVANLVENAIKHIGDGQLRRVIVRTRDGDARGTIRVEVEDTGPGIPAMLGEKVFEPFVRGSDVKSPGFGLGLATVQRLVTAHGGGLGFAPRPGGGTVFWVEMPCAAGRGEADSSLAPGSAQRPAVDADSN